MNSNAQVTQKVIEIAAEQAGVDPLQVTRETHFVNDLGYDSLDAVEFIMKLEDVFGVSVPDDEAEKIQTVGQAVDYVLAHAAAPAGNR